MTNLTLKCVRYNRVFVNNRVRYNRVSLYFQLFHFPNLTFLISIWSIFLNCRHTKFFFILFRGQIWCFRPNFAYQFGVFSNQIIWSCILQITLKIFTQKQMCMVRWNQRYLTLIKRCPMIVWHINWRPITPNMCFNRGIKLQSKSVIIMVTVITNSRLSHTNLATIFCSNLFPL